MIHEGHAGPIEPLASDKLTIQVGTWLTWRFELRMDTEESARFTKQIQTLAAFAERVGINVLAHGEDRRIPVVPIEPLKFINPDVVLSNLDFSRRYLIEGLVSHGVLVSMDIPVLVEALDQCCKSSDHQTQVLTALFTEQVVCNIKEAVASRTNLGPLTTARALQLSGRTRPIAIGQVLVHRCTVTPTRLLLFPAELQISNEALRQHQLQEDSFIRVKFTDEDDRVHINPTVLQVDTACPEKGTIARIRRALKSGLAIAGRHYVFLAYSSESAREHTCWFVAEDHNSAFTADGVRMTLGFGRITENVPAKHAAMIGIVRLDVVTLTVSHFLLLTLCPRRWSCMAISS